MKKNPRKLKLRSETLRDLDRESRRELDPARDLKKVLGGRPPTTGYHHSCYDC